MLLIHKKSHQHRKFYAIRVIFEKLTGIKEVQLKKKPDLKYYHKNMSMASHLRNIFSGVFLK